MQPRHSSCGLPVAIRKEILVSEPTMETLARRLNRLERENRRLKRAGALALAVPATEVLIGQVAGQRGT